MSKLHLEVIKPEGIQIDAEYDHMIIPGVDGDFGVSEGHTSFMTKLRAGVLRLYNGNDEDTYALHDGFVTVEQDAVKIVCEVMEHGKSIDEVRAEESKKRAEKRLTSNDKTVDFRRAELALKRAFARLEAKK